MADQPDRIRTEPVPAVGEQWAQPAYSERIVTVTRVDDSPRGLLVTFRWRPDPGSGWMSAQLPVAQFCRAYQPTAVAERADQTDLRSRIAAAISEMEARAEQSGEASSDYWTWRAAADLVRATLSPPAAPLAGQPST